MEHVYKCITKIASDYKSTVVDVSRHVNIAYYLDPRESSGLGFAIEIRQYNAREQIKLQHPLPSSSLQSFSLSCEHLSRVVQLEADRMKSVALYIGRCLIFS